MTHNFEAEFGQQNVIFIKERERLQISVDSVLTNRVENEVLAVENLGADNEQGRKGFVG